MDHVDDILAQWNRERPDLDVESMGLIGRIKRLYHVLTLEMGKTFADHGLGLASFDVLATLRRSGSPYRQSPSELMASTMVTSGTMTNRIDQLVKLGYVERTSNPDDGRSFLIGLTDEGLSVIEAAVADHVETQRRLTAGLSESQFQRLNGLLKTFLATLEEPEDGP
ncbi:MAG: MarR family transcriptional regulator [Planctomycetes bacterium]|nr:MarR family transcriptional regulator [Planctomycetota bacterium]